MSKSKIKLTVDAAREILASNAPVNNKELEQTLDALKACSEDASPWWIVVLKVLAYAIGLLLAGYGTASAATVIFPAL